MLPREAHTNGVYVYLLRVPSLGRDQSLPSYLVLLDVEGMASPNTTAEFNLKLFAVGCGLVKLLIYNNKGICDLKY